MTKAAAHHVPTAAPEGRLAFTVPEAAHALGISPNMVFVLLRDGHLTGVKLGRRRLIARAEVERLLAEGGTRKRGG